MAPIPLFEVTIVVAADCAALEELAARELRRYLYLLTGSMRPLATIPPSEGPLILVGQGAAGQAAGVLGEQEILVHTLKRDGQPVLVVAGGSAVATQWAVYALLEELGCGFYLGGDALPARRADLTVGPLDLRRKPVFAVRGTLPWYNFLNSPTTWNAGDHRQFYDQLAKQGANFVGFHSYDWEPWAAYPGSWAGMRMGEPVATSGSSRYVDQWGAMPTATADYAFGTDRLFSHGLFGADCAFGHSTHAAAIRAQQALLAESLRYARARGIRTCLGFELVGDPATEENIEGLRERLRHLLATYPLDYVWLWQAEGRGGGAGHRPVDTPEAGQADVAAHFAYLREPWRVAEGVRMSRYFALGYEILHELRPGMKLIVSGWGGDRWMAFTDFYQGLDATLPENVIFSALDNIDPTFEPKVSAVYGKVKQGRECWPIPWFESDGGSTRRDQWGPQPNVHAFAPLLDDAQRMGCTGFLGIHWRTRAVEEVAGYTFRRAWDLGLTPAAFFQRFARTAYGACGAEEMAALHERLEEMGPRWTGAMGQVECGPFTWFSRDGHELPAADAMPAYRTGSLPDPNRLAELAAVETRLATLEDALSTTNSPTAGERLAYLRRTLTWVVSYDRAALQLWEEGPIEAALRAGEAALAKGDLTLARLAGHEALAMLASCGFGAALQVLADNVTNQGELGVLATANGKAVTAFKGLIARAEALADMRVSADLLAAGGWPERLRAWAWPAGNVVEAGQTYTLEVRALGPVAPITVQILYRSLGAVDSPWQTAPCLQVRGGVYQGAIPALDPLRLGFEYGLRVHDGVGMAVVPAGFPASTFSATIMPDGR